MIHKVIYMNTVLEWLYTLGVLLLTFVIYKFVFRFSNRYVKKIAGKTKTVYDDIIIDKAEEPIAFLMLIFGIGIALNQLDMIESVRSVISISVKFTIILTLTNLISRVFNGISAEIISTIINKYEDNGFYVQVLPLIKKVSSSVIWSIGIIIALDNVGIDVTAMIAGLGVGGLALALAAQDIVKNIFGGIMIFLDKPFKVSQRIQVDGFDGIVEEIGIRSTRIRTLNDRVVTIPNSSFSDNSVTNVTSEPSRKVITNLGLTYDMTPEQMELAISVLKTIAETHNNLGLITDNYVISFNNFGDFSLGIIFIYRIVGGQDNLGVQTSINMLILKQFNANGLEMAFPTQTIYTKKS